MSILVTGGAGFIGSHVCEALFKNGKKVVCVDNFNDYYNPKRKEKNLENCLKNKDFKLYKIDICDFEKMKKIFEENKISKIIHLAARAGVRPSLENPWLYAKANIDGLVNVLELGKQYKVKNFVFASSSSVYGANEKIPFSEDQSCENQVSPYALTKKVGEQYCKIYSDNFGMNITCLRFFTVYGPRGRPDMAPYLFTKLISNGEEVKMFGDGSSMRDYTFIKDIVQGIISALDKNFKYEIFNLGNSDPIKLVDFIRIIEELVGKKANIKQVPMPKGDVPITYANISKAKKLLGYDPKTNIKDGMREFIKWYKENN